MEVVSDAMLRWEMQEDEFSVIFITSTQEESEGIARVLVDERLAACVNVTCVTSYFRWDGKFCSEKEALLIIKSRAEYIERIIKRVKELHSYELPEIIAFPIVGGDEEYLKWINDSVK